MASSQIEQYRIAFDKMSLAQKKSFIDRLRNQIQGKNLPAYTKFLAECVQKYNAAARGETVITPQQKSIERSTIQQKSFVPTGRSIEEKYENTIQQYLKNGYRIVSQSGDTTIMFADDCFQRYNTQLTQGHLNTAEKSSTYEILFGNRNNYSSVRTMTAFQGAVNNANTQANNSKSKFEVAIRITKTRQIDISGYTLEKMIEDDGQRQVALKEQADKTAKSNQTLIYVGIGFIILMVLYFIIEIASI